MRSRSNNTRTGSEVGPVAEVHSVLRTRRMLLGCIHLTVGCAILALRYLGGADFFQLLIKLSAEIPTWGLFATAVIKSIYGIGSYLPGTTIILFSMLGRGCSIDACSTW